LHFVAGETSDCPGYLSIIINDRTAAEQLFHYDVMMPCPPRFNLTFTVQISANPRFPQGQRHPAQVQSFEVVLDDAKRVYRLLLTYFRSRGAAEDDGTADSGMAAEAYSSKVVQGHATDVTKVVTACVMTVVVCLSVRLLCDVTVLRREKPVVTGSDSDDVTQPCSTAPTADRLQRRHLVFVAVYVGFNVVYCLLVTFTAISAMFLFHFRSEVDHVTSGGERLGVLTRRAITDVGAVSERSLEVELERAEKRGYQVPAACTRYVDDLTDAVRQSVVVVTQSHQRRPRNSTSVSGLMSVVINRTVSETQRWLLKFVDELDKQFERRAVPVRLVHASFRYRVANSNWLLYSRSLFNRSTALTSLTTSSSSSSVSEDRDHVIRFLEEMMSVHSSTQLRWYKPAHLQR